MNFTAKDVQALRERTGCGMMDCKKALTEADGNVDKAIEILREKGLAAVAKKAGRIASEGVVAIYNDGEVAAIVEVNSETDFVAKNADFVKFCNAVAETVAKTNPTDVEDLKTKTCPSCGETIAEALQEKVLTIGENISIRRFYRTTRPCADYIHGGGRIGVLTEFETDADAKDPAFVEMGKDVCMQITAMSPQFCSQADVPAERVKEETNIVMAQIKNDPKNASKPDAIIEKMAVGKLGKFYKETCLLDQAFVKDDSISVGQYVKNVAAKMGKNIQVVAFTRFEKGEGLQKREDDFAAEVAGMVH